jgi:surfactin synthase thioesterase subunit
MSVFRDAGQGQEMTNSRSEKSQPRAGYRCPLHNSAFGWSYRRLAARSRTALAQVPVGIPIRPAASSYAFLRALVSRISSLWSSGSSTGGRPLPLLGALMGAIMARTNISRNPLTVGSTVYILSVQLIRRNR